MTWCAGVSSLVRSSAGLAGVVIVLVGTLPLTGGSAPGWTVDDPPSKPANAAPAQPPAARVKATTAAVKTPAAAGSRPQVVSRAREKQESRGSEFLRPPDADRYGSADWADVPAWRQTTFFGIRARGQFFIYVVDCSGSMVLEDRLDRAKAELRQSIRRLIEPQRFQVIFYNDEPIPMPGGVSRSANLTSKSQLVEWLRLIQPDGETDPQPALGMALSLRPDAVFLLSDGEFPDGTVEGVARKNPHKVPIHCIDLSGGAAGDQLRQIARDSGGQCVSRPWAGP
jgi:hypothetical protein